MASKTRSYTSFWMLLAAALLSGGWLMKPVPVFILGALAPLIAISEQAKPGIFWEKLEYILVAFLFSFWAAHLFDLNGVLSAISQAIVCTLVFGAAAFARPALGAAAASIVLLAAWLTAEFIFVKLGLSGHVLFLADAFAAHPAWTAWNQPTGYLGISAWVLAANLALHRTFWGSAPLQPGWLVVFVLLVAVPIIYGSLSGTTGVGRADMLALYQGGNPGHQDMYARHGEVVARTCSWIAVLIILFVFVKRHISRK